MTWLAENWHIPWALFCAGALAVAVTRYRRTAPVQMLKRLWFWATGFAIGLAALGMVLMLIGSFTVEWTCQCNVPGHWECKGASCDSNASAHFNAYKHNVSCSRTDWPMRILGSVGRLLLPE
jgi:hypothetical protein